MTDPIASDGGWGGPAAFVTALGALAAALWKGRRRPEGDRRAGMDDIRASIRRICDKVEETHEIVGEIRSDIRLLAYRVDRLERDRP